MSHDSDVASLNSPLGELARVREELKFYQQLIAGNCDGLWHRDLKTGNLWISDQWWRMLGYEPQKAPKLIVDFEKLIHPEDIQKSEAAFMRLMAGEEEYRCQYRIKDAFGSWRVVLFRGKAGTEEGCNAPSYLSGSSSDITDLVEKERREKTLGQIYDRVFHSIPHLIMVKDDRDRFVYANKALAEFWGELDPAKLIGKRDEDYNPHKEEVYNFLKADEEVRRTGEKLVIPIERNTAWDEKKHWLNTIKVPLINDDGTRYVIRVSTFIDDVMEMAEKVKRQEDLSTLASNIAHKLGTRIFTLRNLVAITHHGADESDLSAAFDDITEFAEGFLKLTSADRINAQPLNLLNLVHQALKSFAEKATIILNGVIVSSRGDSLNKFGNPLQFEMTGDSAKLFDIFAELARNSLAWKKEDVHRINVSLQPLHRTNPSIVNSPDSGRFQIIFEDNGPGVPLHQKKKIFEPFVSGRAASLMPENGDAISAAKNDRRGSGTGLGLAIADEVMKSHGGHILENGVPGAGARFVMMLQKMPPAQSIVQQSTSHQ